MLRKIAGSTIIIVSLLLVSTILSILAGDGANLPLCPLIPASAQDISPCLEQEVTISAQEVQILELQLTNNAQQNQLLRARATISAIDANTSPPIIITVPILITATHDPKVTSPVIVVTATQTSEFDPARQSTAATMPENCILHVMEEGDTPFSVAEIYDADPFELLDINGLDDDTSRFLDIGDVVIVPLEGCPLMAADAVAIIGAHEVGATQTTEGSVAAAQPTVTLPPTAVNADVEIVRVIGAGDITAEGIEIRNTGGVVELTGWTLADSQGNVFTFPEQRLFTNGLLTIYTRPGTNNPIALYWSLGEAVWGESGDGVILADEDGDVQATLRL